MTRLLALSIGWFGVCLLTGLVSAELLSLFMLDKYANSAGFALALFMGVMGGIYGTWW